MGENNKTMSLDEILNAFNIDDTSILKDDDLKENEPKINADKVAFDAVFKREKILHRFAGACAAVMTISSVTGIDIDKVLDMFVEEMRMELHSESTKSMMEIGDTLVKIFNLLNVKVD